MTSESIYKKMGWGPPRSVHAPAQTEPNRTMNG